MVTKSTDSLSLPGPAYSVPKHRSWCSGLRHEIASWRITFYKVVYCSAHERALTLLDAAPGPFESIGTAGWLRRAEELRQRLQRR